MFSIDKLWDVVQGGGSEFVAPLRRRAGLRGRAAVPRIHLAGCAPDRADSGAAPVERAGRRVRRVGVGGHLVPPGATPHHPPAGRGRPGAGRCSDLAGDPVGAVVPGSRHGREPPGCRDRAAGDADPDGAHGAPGGSGAVWRPRLAARVDRARQAAHHGAGRHHVRRWVMAGARPHRPLARADDPDRDRLPGGGLEHLQHVPRAGRRPADGADARSALPRGTLSPETSLVFGALLACFAVPLVFLGGNLLTGILGLAALGSYVGVYTPLKRHSAVALFVGAVPGALPPLMGWTTVTGRLDAPGLALFAILFFWQIPHFCASPSTAPPSTRALGSRCCRRASPGARRWRRWSRSPSAWLPRRWSWARSTWPAPPISCARWCWARSSSPGRPPAFAAPPRRPGPGRCSFIHSST